jgi:hypothetical protein
MKNNIVPIAQIQARIHIVRRKRVMLDADLARFYGVGTRDLNKAVNRNLGRFPEDFAFMLTIEETRNLMFQSGTSSLQPEDGQVLRKASRNYGGRRKPALVFTEQGVAMLASVLRSPRAVAVSVALVRAFVQLRELLATHRELAVKLTELERKLSGHDHAIRNLFETIRQLLEPPEKPTKEMGFHTLIGRKKAPPPSCSPGRPGKTQN